MAHAHARVTVHLRGTDRASGVLALLAEMVAELADELGWIEEAAAWFDRLDRAGAGRG